MSDSDKRFDILRDIKPCSFESLATKFTHSISCQELAAANADVDLEQLSIPGPSPGPSPQQELDGCAFVCVAISLVDKSAHWA